MSSDLEPLLKRLHLANARRVWRDLVQRAEKEDWSYETLLFTLFSEEVAHRRGTRLTRALGSAAFPFLRTIEEYDFSYQSTLRLTTVGSLLAPDFVTEGRSVIFQGKPGRGKTHLAIAIAYRALQNGFDALFTTAAELIDHLSAASREGKLRDALAVYMRPHVLVVNEVGYLTYGNDAANVLYHVVNDRHIRRRAMIFTTNKDPKRWGTVLHDDDLADAIVDRILERGRLLRLDGPSVRTKHLPPDELGSDDQQPARVSGKNRPEFPERTTNDFNDKEGVSVSSRMRTALQELFPGAIKHLFEEKYTQPIAKDHGAPVNLMCSSESEGSDAGRVECYSAARTFLQSACDPPASQEVACLGLQALEQRNFTCMAGGICGFRPVIQAVNMLPEDLELVFAPNPSAPTVPLDRFYRLLGGLLGSSELGSLCGEIPERAIANGNVASLTLGVTTRDEPLISCDQFQ